jgi:hypothetical protein
MLFMMFILAQAFAAPMPLSVAPGDPALVFELPVVNAGVSAKPTVSLSDLVGVLPAHPQRALVLHFFTSSREGPSLQVLARIHKRYAGRGLAVLAVCAQPGGADALSERLAGLRLPFPVLHDAHQIVSGRYGLTEYPITLVIDGEGRIFAIGQPVSAAMEAELGSEIEGVLRGSQPSPQ